MNRNLDAHQAPVVEPTLNQEPGLPAINDESGHVSRRAALVILVGSAVGAVVGLRACSNDSPDTSSKDILANPDKVKAFIGDYQATAAALAEDTEMPLPYEVFLAVGMHESDSGTSELAQNANNMHGIVAKDGWEGGIYEKPTQESVSKASVGDLAAIHGSKLKILHENTDGSIRVQYPRPFRKYKKPEDSFADFQSKVYFKNQDGSYRYSDVVSYLQGGERDPRRVVELMVDKDEEGELAYATGSEWLSGVKNYITIIQTETGNSSTGTTQPAAPSDPVLPPDGEDKIDMGKISFEGFDEPREEDLKDTFTKALESLRGADYKDFKKDAVLPKWKKVRELIGEEKYQSGYNGDSIAVKYLIWHLWANGVNGTGSSTDGPYGNSHKVSIETQIKSWANNSGSSVQFMLGDKERDHELWQLAKTPATRAGHARNGVMDEGDGGREDLGNSNSIAIEVQADSIFDVDQVQVQKMIMWAALQLFEEGIIDEGMKREKVDALVEQTVIGHGKNEGLEFGYKYTRPLVQALQQYVFLVIQSQ